MIDVLVVDDEPLARESIALVVQREPDVRIAGSCSGVDAPRLVAETRPHVMFLDVQMPVLDGFEVLARIGLDAVPALVFVTAYDRYAVRAFDVHALDYVLKPFDDARLLAALARARTRLAHASATTPGALAALLNERECARPYLQRFIVRTRERSVIVDVGDVDCIEAADDYVELHVGTTVHIMRERLADLETRLDPGHFVRIHRSAIVNVDRVREIHPLVRGDALVVLDGGASFRCSRSRRPELERLLSSSPRDRDRSPQTR